MARRNSITEKLTEGLFELTGYIWQVGAVVSLLLVFLSYMSFGLANSLVARLADQPILAALEKPSWVLYSIPLLFFLGAAMFAHKTYTVYRNGSGR